MKKIKKYNSMFETIEYTLQQAVIGTGTSFAEQYVYLAVCLLANFGQCQREIKTSRRDRNDIFRSNIRSDKNRQAGK